MLSSRSVLALSFFAAVALTALGGSSRAAVFCTRQSCLLAHDINGIQLDMTVEQVTALMPRGLKPIGGGQAEGDKDDVHYDFGFSARGRLFRIDSTQPLGQFQPDRNFALRLTERLTKKFGPPETNMLPGGPAFWSFAEYYITDEVSPMRLTRETESLSVMFGGGGYFGPVSLQMKLMDFRIPRRDEAILNGGPQARAQDRLHF